MISTSSLFSFRQIIAPDCYNIEGCLEGITKSKDEISGLEEELMMNQSRKPCAANGRISPGILNP